MTRFYCPKCSDDFEADYFWAHVGDPVVCPTCQTTWETDWDYTDLEEGNATTWIVGEAKPDGASK
jgi:hypothetical protein